jgi:hypothetical protein
MRQQRRRSRDGSAIALILTAVLVACAGSAQAAGPPVVGSTWASAVFSSTARLSAQVNPNGLFATYHFDYIAKAAYDANVAASKDPFAGTFRVPAVDSNIGSGTGLVTITQLPSGLSADTAYRYRVVAKNSAGSTAGQALLFVTQGTGGGSVLADGRGWEMVSPVDKNGGEVEAPGGLAGGGVLQAAAQGGSITYGSAASFADGQGAPPASQYVASRDGGGWSTQNVTSPVFSGTYDAKDQGAPYQLFSADLTRGLLLNGDHCRGEGTDCAVANPPLAGTDAPAGYQNYYLREGSGFTALFGAANVGFLSLDPAEFDLRLAGTAPDLRHSVLSSCAALTANATEVTAGGGCDPAMTNLYEYSPGGGLSLVNLLPGQGTGNPGASLAAQSGAVSSDGGRVYWSDLATGNLYLRAGGQTKQADAAAGGGGAFETASADGSVAFFTKGGHLWRYLAAGDGATDLTPSGGVDGVLGASADGAYVYYQDAGALRLWHAGTTTTAAPGAAAAPSDYPPTTGTARVSVDGTRLLFLSILPLTGYDNIDLNTGLADSQVFLYDSAGSGALTCVSCNPTQGRPVGPSSIPGSIANGTAVGSTNSYKPRVLSANGRRVFFDSRDALVLADTDNAPDAYQWEAQGEGSCSRSGGCISLISSGRAAGGAKFVDASADGTDAFFLTDGSLVGADRGALDLYDARIGGGFPEADEAELCQGDSCQSLPSPPIDPTLTTLLAGPGNPSVRYPKSKRRACRGGTVKRKRKCVKKTKAKPQNKRRRGGRNSR